MKIKGLVKKVINKKGVRLLKPALLKVITLRDTTLLCLYTIWRNFRIRIHQHRMIRSQYSSATRHLILFLTPGLDIVNGGILSITSLFEETIKFKNIHGANVLLCTVPGEPLLLKYTKFDNRNYLFRFSQVLLYFRKLDSILLHIPEYSIPTFLKNIKSKDKTILKSIMNVHINILLQNITMLPPLQYIEKLRQLGSLTCTTAHKQYSNNEMRKKLGCPLHLFSWFLSPELYSRQSYKKKENIMIVSPDPHPNKKALLNSLQKQLPFLKIVIIRNMTYPEYREIIQRAKWGITFGEGLDGYFVEMVFCGGISFSLYNTEFFTTDFKLLRTIYSDFTTLSKKLWIDLKELDREPTYQAYQDIQYKLCSNHFNSEIYRKNIELFYKKDYTLK